MVTIWNDFQLNLAGTMSDALIEQREYRIPKAAWRIRELLTSVYNLHSYTGFSPRCRLRCFGIGLLVSLMGLTVAVTYLYTRASYHFRCGCSDLHRHHNTEALAHFQDYLRAWPNDPTALLLATRACWRLQEFDEAENHLRRYQNVAGSSEDFIRESFLLVAARGDLDNAAHYLQKLLDNQDRDSPLILESLVSGCMRQFRFVEAAAYLQRWLDMLPDDTQALLFQISFDHLRPSPRDAIAKYHRVLQLDPTHDSSRLQLAATLVEERQYEEALLQLEMLRQRHPHNCQLLVLLAECQDALGREDDAEQILEEVLSQAPQHAGALTARGRLALRRGRLSAAEVWLRNALVSNPAHYQARYQLIKCLIQQGQTDEVSHHEQQLRQMEADQRRLRQIMIHELSRNPHDPRLRRELATILLRRGDIDKGLRWLHNSLRHDPVSVPLHRTLFE